MSESTGKGHQVPDSTSLSTRLATEYNETTVPGTDEIALSTKVPIENTIALGGQVEDTMAAQKTEAKCLRAFIFTCKSV